MDIIWVLLQKMLQKISNYRDEQDKFALKSQEKALKAQKKINLKMK